MNEFLDRFSNEIIKLQLKEKEIDVIYMLNHELVDKIKILNDRLMRDNINTGLEFSQIINTTTDVVHRNFSKYSSKYKRNKIYEQNENYVAPDELAMGAHWDMAFEKSLNVAVPKLIQSRFEYIPITKSLENLFKDEQFCTMYLQYNDNRRNHKCDNEKFVDFCCGSIYKNLDFFQRHPNALQIVIATDDFEVCSPLQSKATLYKICAVYFTIKNVPKQFQSKLNNIYLVALCNVDDLKTKHTDFNDIWKLVLNDLLNLEDSGITIKGDITLKGTLTHLLSDNLGLSVCQGFSGSFNSTYYCRFCECTRKQCQALTKKLTKEVRTIENYSKQIEIISQCEKVDLKVTKGIKFYCILSDLKYFHIIVNQAIDIMHDLNEGVIPVLLKFIILHLQTSKIINLDDLNAKIRFYGFGILSRRNSPSLISVDKHNVGQNATQCKCLFEHMPFLLTEFRNNSLLTDVWICMETLLRITTIVYSDELTETDLEELDHNIQLHLESINKHFNSRFIPKHHHLLHYSDVIRALGPVVDINMFRFERKHKVLKKFANETHSFINTNKSIAIKHQKLLSINGNTYNDEIICGAKKKVSDDLLTLCESMCTNIFTENKELYKIEWFLCNSLEYRKDLVILCDSFLYEIFEILVVDNAFVFLCYELKIKEFDKFLNSFEIEKINKCQHVLIKFHKLQYRKPFEMKRIDEKYYIIEKNLTLRKLFF